MSADTPSTADPACRNLRWAAALLHGLIAGGVRELVLSPGSRSTPVVLAAQRQPALRLTPILDERSAAFFALGLAQATERPVALLCTSGSAPAHWFPAVIEASTAGIPLLLLSADRPPLARSWGGNQTIDQTRLFGTFVREFHDPGPPDDRPPALRAMTALGRRVAAVSQGRRPGPVHLNLPFPEPLVPRAPCPRALPDDLAGAASLPAASDPAASRWSPAPGDPDPRPWLQGRGAILVGPDRYAPDFAPALWDCAQTLGVPVLTDPLSGLRAGPAPAAHRIARADSLLRHPEAARRLRPDWILRFGRAPVSKRLQDWSAGVPTVLIDPAERWADPDHAARAQLGADPAAFCRWLVQQSGLDPAAPDWLLAWRAGEEAIARLAARHLAAAPWCEAHLIARLWRDLPAGAALLCANSLPIRQLDTWSGARDAPLRLFGQRGASGIDGQLSTLAGLTLGAATPSPGTWGLLGDLAFAHDLSGLLLLRRLDRPCLVLDNGGGRIFDYLPQRQLPGLETLWRTPTGLSPGALAAALDVPHARIRDAASCEAVLAPVLAAAPGPTAPGPTDPGGAGLIEVHLDAEASREVHESFWRAIPALSID